jgi:hypothetical protein
MKSEELLRYERMYRAMKLKLGTARLVFDHPSAFGGKGRIRREGGAGLVQEASDQSTCSRLSANWSACKPPVNS